jgi:hypothetical protein
VEAAFSEGIDGDHDRYSRSEWFREGEGFVSPNRHWTKKEGLPLKDNPLNLKAGLTRLELATSDVTGRRSNQLNYSPAIDTAGESAVTVTHLDGRAAYS